MLFKVTDLFACDSVSLVVFPLFALNWVFGFCEWVCGWVLFTSAAFNFIVYYCFIYLGGGWLAWWFGLGLCMEFRGFQVGLGRFRVAELRCFPVFGADRGG